VRLLCPIILILFSAVDRVWHNLSLSDWIAAEFIRHDLPGLSATGSQQPPEEPCRGSTITLGLKIHIDHIAILIYGSPKVMLLAVYFDEDFVDVEGVPITSVLSFQTPGVQSTELDTPETDRLATDSNATFSEEILDIPVAEIKAIVEPDGVADDIGRETVALICIHEPILSIPAVSLAIPAFLFQGLWLILLSLDLHFYHTKDMKLILPPALIGVGILTYSLEQFGGVFSYLGIFNVPLQASWLVWLLAFSWCLLRLERRKKLALTHRETGLFSGLLIVIMLSI
jgi:hypothetical protein